MASSPRKSSKSTSSAPPASSTVEIRVVYPSARHTVYDDSTFVMGQVKTANHADCVFKMNGHPVPLSEHGYYSWRVATQAGDNLIRLTVHSKTSASTLLAERKLTIHGSIPYPVLPSAPLAIHPETLLPASDVWVMPTDTVHVACSASADTKVALLANITAGFMANAYLEPSRVELPTYESVSRSPAGDYIDSREGIFAKLHWMDRRIPVQGYHQADVLVSVLLKNVGELKENVMFSLSLQLDSLSKKGTQLASKTIGIPGRVRVLTRPVSGVITVDLAVTRTAPVDGSRLTPLPKGVKLTITGLDRGWYRVSTSQDGSLYIAQHDVQIFEYPQFLLPVASVLNAIRVAPLSAENPASKSQQALLKLLFSGAPASHCPIQIQSVPLPQHKDGHRLLITIYNAQCCCDFIQYAPAGLDVREIHWRPVTPTSVEVWVDFTAPLAGYDYALVDGEWQITVRTLPRELQAIRILIDPGHGGSETGSTGLDGTPEKKLNLLVSKKLEASLRHAGFQVFMSRTTDVDVSLGERGRKAKDTDADIVLSIHHNALPDGRNPQEERGVSTFYYHSFSKSLAESVLQSLTTIGKGDTNLHLPSYGLLYDSLYMTRIHRATAILIELGFFTHPDDYEHVTNGDFQNVEVQRITQALIEYCSSPSRP